MPALILVVDDDLGHLRTIERVIAHEGWEVVTAASAEAALDVLRARAPELIVTDWMMPGMSGLELLKAAKLMRPSLQVIVMTAFGTVERAVDAMKEGAFDFVEKPVKRAALLRSVRLALERVGSGAESAAEGPDGRRPQRQIIGRSEPIRRINELIRQVAPTPATVLIAGASGTGKELVARAIHELSPRARKPFVALNCAAVAASLIESELFGHEKGAFTGAHQRKLGRFESADGGTLFLDEIAELQPEMQAKLLRVLQEGELERVGGTRPIRIDVRIVAATNRTLGDEVAAGRFREDLFYRLNVIGIELPTLAERRSDIPLLVEHFLQHFAQAYGRPPQRLSAAALASLGEHDWPGNVRELRNAIERAVVLNTAPTIEHIELVGRSLASPTTSAFVVPIGTPLKEVKRRLILETLRLTGGDKKQTAALLKIAQRTIYRLLEENAESDDDDEESVPVEG